MALANCSARIRRWRVTRHTARVRTTRPRAEASAAAEQPRGLLPVAGTEDAEDQRSRNDEHDGCRKHHRRTELCGLPDDGDQTLLVVCTLDRHRRRDRREHQIRGHDEHLDAVEVARSRHAREVNDDDGIAVTDARYASEPG